MARLKLLGREPLRMAAEPLIADMPLRRSKRRLGPTAAVSNCSKIAPSSGNGPRKASRLSACRSIAAAPAIGERDA